MPIICDIKVTPSAGKVAITLDKSGRLKCYLKSPPEKGKANAELIKLLAKTLGLPQDAVEITGGLASRTKRIKIALDITFEQLMRGLALSDKRH